MKMKNYVIRKNLSVMALTGDEEFLHNNLISLMIFYQSKESTQYILATIKSARCLVPLRTG
ncbi:MAG: hypothetical protein EKK61_01955 [Rickettsiales bacterium]|nr:MAG: hypothetical protein EKK61_01955 [Rickettsiales bacterium]